MKRNINSLTGSKVIATDGEIGEVKDFYFDDSTWQIRYLIIETGSWLSSRKVLVSPQAVIGWAEDRFSLNLTIDQIKNSPDIDTELPVSRQQEEILNKHHAWENNWDNNFFGGGTKGDTIPAGDFNEPTSDIDFDTHLQSAAKVSGYHIHAMDGEIGYLNNFILGDESWVITDFVIDTGGFFGGKKVLVPVGHVDALQWYNAEVFLDIDKANVENSAAYVE